ncbi:MAG: prepilin-type N-terminal cleavage/methylation domain-containing protein [Candidatus Hinthialibacter antarcticus]|nr:prepilin-type N-terminal cleavage/methylation domain-containing protein [Candidatus Hinthialibacter antarcticus]
MKMKQYTRRRAFTLIELLIVVAIIGILAAIAVPNFLNAITRSKVARVQADLKSIYTAVELYRMERVDYPAAPVFAGLRLYNFSERLKVLTTPTAYIADIPKDPFPHQSKFEFDTTADLRKIAPGADSYGYFRSDFSGHNGNYYFGTNKWMATSSGPDGYIQYLGYFPETETQAEELCSLCSIDVPFVELQAVQYNPSNGVTSAGEIIRWGMR